MDIDWHLKNLFILYLFSSPFETAPLGPPQGERLVRGGQSFAGPPPGRTVKCFYTVLNSYFIFSLAFINRIIRCLLRYDDVVHVAFTHSSMRYFHKTSFRSHLFNRSASCIAHTSSNTTNK